MWQLIVCVALIGTSQAFDVETLDEKAVSGSLLEIKPDGILLDTPDGKLAISTEKLLKLSAHQKEASSLSPTISIELQDGSTIPAERYAVEGEQASFTTLNKEKLQLSSRSIKAVRLQRESDSLADQYSRIAANKYDNDVIIVRKDDNLDYHQGVIEDINDDTVRFKMDGEDLPIKRTKVYAIIYHHPSNQSSPASICSVIDKYGSRWQASKLSFDKKLVLTTPTGLLFSCDLADVSQIDYSQGKIIYLSDIKPESVSWTPFFNTSEPLPSMKQLYAPRFDKNFQSNPMQLAGKKYSKGIAVRSRTEIIYRLSGTLDHFKAIAGIDDSVRPKGQVRLTIRGDNNTLFDTTITGTDHPKTIDIDIKGVRKLSILADFDDQPAIGDHLDLCNARVTK